MIQMKQAAGVLFCLLAAPCFGQQGAPAWEFRDAAEQTYVMNQSSRVVLSPGTDSESEVSFSRTLDFSWRVAAVNRGAATVAVEVRRARLNAVGPSGAAVEFDTDSDEKGEGYAAQLEPVLRALCGAELSARVSAAGAISKQQMPQSLAEAIDAAPGGDLIEGFSTAAGLENLFSLGWPSTEKEKVSAGQFGTFVVEMKHSSETDGDGVTRFNTRGQVVLLAGDASEGVVLKSREPRVSGRLVLDGSTGLVRSSERTVEVVLEATGNSRTQPVRVEHRVEFEAVDYPGEDSSAGGSSLEGVSTAGSVGG
ncbi:MAG: hypothetical protein AAGA92_14580 [Planctomycetota bacterium]